MDSDDSADGDMYLACLRSQLLSNLQQNANDKLQNLNKRAKCKLVQKSDDHGEQPTISVEGINSVEENNVSDNVLFRYKDSENCIPNGHDNTSQNYAGSNDNKSVPSNFTNVKSEPTEYLSTVNQLDADMKSMGIASSGDIANDIELLMLRYELLTSLKKNKQPEIVINISDSEDENDDLEQQSLDYLPKLLSKELCPDKFNAILEDIYPQKTTEKHLLKNELVTIEYQAANLRRESSAKFNSSKQLLKKIDAKKRMIVDLQSLTNSIKQKIETLQKRFHEKNSVMVAQLEDVRNLEIKRQHIINDQKHCLANITELENRIQFVSDKFRFKSWRDVDVDGVLTDSDQEMICFLKSCCPVPKITYFINLYLTDRLPFYEPRQYKALRISKVVHSVIIRKSFSVIQSTLPVAMALMFSQGVNNSQTKSKSNGNNVNSTVCLNNSDRSGTTGTSFYICKNSNLQAVPLTFGPIDNHTIPNFESRYFLQELRNIEDQLEQDLCNARLWIEAALRHSRRISEADKATRVYLHVLSRGIEYCPYSIILWCEYLKCSRTYRSVDLRNICESALNYTKYNIDVAWKIYDLCPSVLLSNMDIILRNNRCCEDNYCLTVILLMCATSDKVEKCHEILKNEIPRIPVSSSDHLLLLIIISCHLHLLMFDTLPDFLFSYPSEHVLNKITVLKTDGFFSLEDPCKLTRTFSQIEVMNTVDNHLSKISEIANYTENISVSSRLQRLNPITSYIYSCILLISNRNIADRFEAKISALSRNLSVNDQTVLSLQRKVHQPLSRFWNDCRHPSEMTGFTLWAFISCYIKMLKRDSSNQTSIDIKQCNFRLPTGQIELTNLSVDKLLGIFSGSQCIDIDSSFYLISIFLMSTCWKPIDTNVVETIMNVIDPDVARYFIISLERLGIVAFDSFDTNCLQSLLNSLSYPVCIRLIPDFVNCKVFKDIEVTCMNIYYNPSTTPQQKYLSFKYGFACSNFANYPIVWLMFYRLSLELGLIKEAKQIITKARDIFCYLNYLQSKKIDV
ncbi:hypothetical protein GJ496_002518 [Pomphorhynchus laevis]|nr:hypothetical protein GJ496_002518 [Pomphorhynchus laevis]